MGRRRKSKKKKVRARGKDVPGPGPGGGKLAQAVHEGQRGRAATAIRLAIEARRTARAAAERRAADQILAETRLHAALGAKDRATMLGELDRALASDPASSRVRFYRALTLLSLGRVEEGRAALEESFEASSGIPPAGGTAYARQLARMESAKPWDTAGLSAAEVRDLQAIETLRGRTPHPPDQGGRPGHDALVQLGLFPGSAAPVQPAPPPPDPGAWDALLELTRDQRAAPVKALEAAAVQAPEAARGVLRYYQGVAALRQSHREEALELLGPAASGGLDTPWLRHNLVVLLREEAQELAEAERWTEVVRLAGALPAGVEDRILAETIALAHDHLAHQAARAGQWAEAARHWRSAETLHPRRSLAQNLALAEEALEHWSRAAEAWRAMARRRPRKRDHPDYLPAKQVAAVWAHAAECYGRVEDDAEALTCLDSALRHAPDDPALRLRRAELLMKRDVPDAAERELDRILAIEPRHLEALTLRAMVEQRKPWGDAAPLWRRVLGVEPTNADAREALARSWIDKARAPRSRFGFGSKMPLPGAWIPVLQQGLLEVPGHPRLLLALGHAYWSAARVGDARTVLLQASDAAGQDMELQGDALHELVHAALDEDGPLDELMARIRRHPGLLPGFWLDQVERVLACELPETWFDRFLEEALVLVEQAGGKDSRATVLFKAYEIADDADADVVARKLEERIRREAAGSGAVELIAAERRLEEHHDVKGARRLFRAAAERARRARDGAMLELVRSREAMMPGDVRNLIRLLAGLFE